MSTEMITHERLASREGNVWSYVSPSRLNCWIACPLKFKLKYLDGVKTPTAPALFLGKMVHSGLETLYRHRQLGIELEAVDLSNRLAESWEQAAVEEEMKFECSAAEQTLRQQAVDLITAYVQQVPDDEPDPLAVEVALEAPLVDPAADEDLGIPLVGIIDLVLDGQEGPVIADFKTSSRSSQPLEISHEIQLSAYSYLFPHVSAQPEAGLEIRSLIKTKVPKVEIHGYPARTEAHIKRLFCLFREYLDALDAGRFNFRPGWGCGMCDFRETHCARWSG